jgi:hypothetical protein
MDVNDEFAAEIRAKLKDELRERAEKAGVGVAARLGR